jgi:FKBP-type peptidyl-prolyl cis-trans isomerase
MAHLIAAANSPSSSPSNDRNSDGKDEDAEDFGAVATVPRCAHAAISLQTLLDARAPSATLAAREHSPSTHTKEFMKIILAITVALFVFQTTFAAETDTLDFKDPKIRKSYAVGVDIAESLNRQGLGLDGDALAAAIRDALGGKELRMKKEEVTQALKELREEMVKKMQAEMEAEQQKMAELAAKNKKAGAEFLAENKKKEGVVVTASGLQYKILTKGNGKIPKPTDIVKVHYRGTLIDGKEFDSSHKHGEPAKFPVNRVIKGWVEVLQLMPVGSKWQVFIPSELAYGEDGYGEIIEPNSVLIFEVELLSIEDQPAAPAPQP